MSAFDTLVRRFQDMAVGYAYSLLEDFHLAQDAAQDAFVQAFLRLPQLREPEAFPRWFKTVVFTCCSRITRRKQLVFTDHDGLAESASSSASDPSDESLSSKRGSAPFLSEQSGLRFRVQASLNGGDQFSWFISELR
ncbi:MAG: RNA polymerase sigma factor, partial [Chloroflexota bacterium]